MLPSRSEQSFGVAVQLEELPEGWEAARSFHRLKRILGPPLRRVIQERAIDAILARARELLRHATRPTRRQEDGYPSAGDLDLEATLERVQPWTADDLRVQRTEPREADVVVMLDMSLSMTGDKIALIALATAILRLKLDSLAVVSFDTKAHTLVAGGEIVPVRETVRRVLAVPAQGYTNIEAGLLAGAQNLARCKRRERVGIMMTDGIANMGGDPVKAAHRFPRLHVVQVGIEEAQGSETCLAMARQGRGRHYRAHRYEELPAVVRQLVRECFGA